ncbi:MAG: DoxX family protein [Candidatus Marinimicrobia bacterium]|jgi:putative oxidoreductase|nr:DoxX family protein [Candidatus Neomarinimicrobiota bacterium]MDD5060986.1 DoxX family protein [Candidatus Neomarinimicrobiota bacterium]MDD5230656.1 DoxX family protein [Candidatus Neomarinimicrobiota bacterium]MDD5539253.1 DoxX family protein [Candidatus Neomarinimicrobiota bacterium]
MKRIFDIIFNPGDYSNIASSALLLLRMIVGIFMLTHGIGKFMMLVGDRPIRFVDPIGLGVTASLILVVFAEVFCSIFLIVGVATRLAVIPLLVTMLVAALITHASDPFIKKELPLLYAAIFIVIALAGAGKYSIDSWIYERFGENS